MMAQERGSSFRAHQGEPLPRPLQESRMRTSEWFRGEQPCSSLATATVAPAAPGPLPDQRTSPPALCSLHRLHRSPPPRGRLRSHVAGVRGVIDLLYALVSGNCIGVTAVIKLFKSEVSTMQGISMCNSVTSPHGTICRTACVARSDLHPPYETYSVRYGACSLQWRVGKLSTGTNGRRMKNTIKTNAKWLFGGDGRTNDARLERSEAANEDILIFYFQMDLQTRIQYALNIEQFEVAKQLREKLTEIETEIIRQREAKRGSSKTEAQDKALNLLRVRADLQKAIDSENYALAAGLRDEIAKLEAESLAVSAKALAYQNVKYAFRLGQKVRHKVHGYRGVICGMDPVCCESKSWIETANIEKLSKGPNQPFYQVLVDVYVDPDLLVAYVAEENILAAAESEKGRFDHPYIEFLFYGENTAGDFIPIKQLREKYDQPRYEDTGDENDDTSDS